MNNSFAPRTLLEAVRYFSDLDVCHSYMLSIKWPDGKITCPKCGGENVGNIASRRMLQCKAKGCRKQFSAKVGTIFEDSPLGLDKWFVAVWCITNDKNGISSYEVHRALGVTQKTAWFMLHRVRLAMKTGTFQKFIGVTEADETYMGGKAQYMHAKRREKEITKRGPAGKTAVLGILQRTTPDCVSQVKTVVVPNVKAVQLQPYVRAAVEKGSHVYTDFFASYRGLDADYVHKTVDHAVAYVTERVHTNGLENFWSLLKRMVKGTYVHVSPEHLTGYLDEETFRFNERDGNDGTRFLAVMKGTPGRRVTYKALTGKDDRAAAGKMPG
jgi:transposase-like protein